MTSSQFWFLSVLPWLLSVNELVSLFINVVYGCVFLEPERKGEMMESGGTTTGTTTGATCTETSPAGGEAGAKAGVKAEGWVEVAAAAGVEAKTMMQTEVLVSTRGAALGGQWCQGLLHLGWCSRLQVPLSHLSNFGELCLPEIVKVLFIRVG